MWKMRAPQPLVVEVTCGVGELTKKYRLEVPAKTPLDDVEALLMICGAIPPRITHTLEPVKIDPDAIRRQRGGGNKPRR